MYVAFNLTPEESVLIARVTKAAVAALDLKEGRPVVALIKATAFDRPDE